MEKADMYEEIRWREMKFLFDEPETTNPMIVQEFYANCPKNLCRSVIVRGRVVDASILKILQVLRLPQFTGDIDHYHDTQGVTWDIMIVTICAGGRPIWLQENITLHSKSFTHEAKCWFTIICSRLLPTGNTTDVNHLQALLVWCFITKKDFDVARIIGDEMILRSPLLSKGFYFPSLVTRLCLLDGVPTNLTNGALPVKAAFRASKITVGRDAPTTIELDDEDDAPAPMAPSRRSYDGAGSSRRPHTGAGFSRSQSSRPMLHSLEEEVADLRSSVDGLHVRMGAMSQQHARSESRMIAWFRALGRACHVDPSTVSDSE
ncbi:uncharacterized protein [Nicotiana sylvestris]|uniref:uncharacterized protein isoform X1 n=1 Tax=Nicotiana sylvestris TaxID=4096 RepID=UPI00388C5DC4